MGRKPLNEIAKQSQLRILLTAAERAELDAYATSVGIPTSTWARDLLLATARSAVKPPLVKQTRRKTPKPAR